MEEQRGKLVCLEGLRGAASFIVVLSHLQKAFYADLSPSLVQAFASLPSFVSALISGLVKALCDGSYSVWIFWVISGIALSYKFFHLQNKAKAKPGQDYLIDAFLRRYPRLLVPVLASVAVVFVLLRCGLILNHAATQQPGPLFANDWLDSVYNFHATVLGALKSGVWDTFFNYTGATTYNLVLWTMSAELFGSLALFGFLALFGASHLRLLLYPLLAVVIYLMHAHGMNSFLAGIFLCDVYVNRILSENTRVRELWSRLSTSRLFSFMVPLAVLTYVGNAPHYETIYLPMAFFMVAAVLWLSPVHEFFTRGVFVFLGKISFGLYLIHVPIICSLGCWLYLTTLPTLGSVGARLLAALVVIPVSLVAGYLMTILFDDWGIRLARLGSDLFRKATDRLLPSQA